MNEPRWDSYDGPIYTGIDELPDFEIERQDKLDKITHRFLQVIAEECGIDYNHRPLDWDIGSIMAVHEAVRRVLYWNHRVRVPYAAIDYEEEVMKASWKPYWIAFVAVILFDLVVFQGLSIVAFVEAGLVGLVVQGIYMAFRRG